MKRVSKAALHKFVSDADSVTTLQTDFGTWAAIVNVNGQDYEVETASLDPTGDATIEPVSQEQADAAMAADYRTVLRR